MMTKKNKRKKWQDTSRIFGMIRNSGLRITIVTHVNPDGDAIGSSLGLMKLLSNIGHHCTVISPNDYPDFLKWLPGNDTIIVFENDGERALRALEQSDMIISVDFNTLSRIKQLSPMVTNSTAYKLLIDHHPDPDDFADCTISDTTVSSSAEIVWQFIQYGNLHPYVDTDIATCLFTGIMTDTGCFSHNSSSADTYRAVAALLDYNVDKDNIYFQVYDNFSFDRMRLLGYSLNEKMEIIPEYRTAFIWLTLEDQKKYSFQVGDSEGFVNYPLSIKGILFSALFIEKEDHIKISFRSRGSFAVNRFAQKYFKGGGHRNASGGESEESMNETIDRFRKTLFMIKESLTDNEI